MPQFRDPQYVLCCACPSALGSCQCVFHYAFLCESQYVSCVAHRACFSASSCASPRACFQVVVWYVFQCEFLRVSQKVFQRLFFSVFDCAFLYRINYREEWGKKRPGKKTGEKTKDRLSIYFLTFSIVNRGKWKAGQHQISKQTG